MYFHALLLGPLFSRPALSAPHVLACLSTVPRGVDAHLLCIFHGSVFGRRYQYNDRRSQGCSGCAYLHGGEKQLGVIYRRKFVSAPQHPPARVNFRTFFAGRRRFGGSFGSAGHGSWVKWVDKCEWVTWVTRQYRKTLDP